MTDLELLARIIECEAGGEEYIDIALCFNR